MSRVPRSPAPRILLISNGHGEDLNGGLIADGLRQCSPGLELAALPIVGAGSAYGGRGLPLLFQGRTLPSGGMVYQGLNIWKDLAAGWLQQSVAQLWIAWRQGRHYDLVVSIGDHVPLIFALLTGRPTVVFLVSTSSFYEGRLRLSALTRWCCRRRRVRLVLTRDAFTATDLQAQGLAKALFLGYPIMDLPAPDPGQVARLPGSRTLALVPGSRFPEALHNLVLMLRLCSQLGAWSGMAAGVFSSPWWRARTGGSWNPWPRRSAGICPMGCCAPPPPISRCSCFRAPWRRFWLPVIWWWAWPAPLWSRRWASDGRWCSWWDAAPSSAMPSPNPRCGCWVPPSTPWGGVRPRATSLSRPPG